MLGSIDGGTTIRGGTADSASPPNGAAKRRRRRWLSTPTWLRLGVVVASLPVLAFALAIHVGLDRNSDTVQTVGEDATEGITVAQTLKLNLAELDGIAVEELLTEPALGAGGFPEAYNDKRVEVQQNLIAAAGESAGPGYSQTLVDIDYVLAHYHSAMADTFAAAAAGDPAAVVQNYGKAHEIMSGTLLPEADRFDKAHTYVLNDTYGRHRDRSIATTSWIVVTWGLLTLGLIGLQLEFARRFRRILNVPLLLATLLAGVTVTGALQGLDRSADRLSVARDQAFDSIHRLARAHSTAVAAQQAQGDFLLDPADPTADTAFQAQTDQLFRVTDTDGEDVADIAIRGETPSTAAGHLAAVAREDQATDGVDATGVLQAFGNYLKEDQDIRRLVGDGNTAAAIEAIYGEASAFDEFDKELAESQRAGQARFDNHAESADSATRGLARLNLALAAGMVGLIVAGIGLRLREYA